MFGWGKWWSTSSPVPRWCWRLVQSYESLAASVQQGLRERTQRRPAGRAAHVRIARNGGFCFQWSTLFNLQQYIHPSIQTSIHLYMVSIVSTIQCMYTWWDGNSSSNSERTGMLNNKAVFMRNVFSTLWYVRNRSKSYGFCCKKGGT